jgi:two-component system, NtrC family, sensor histidine kinase HydH
MTQASPTSGPTQPFRLTTWFGGVALLAIAVIAAASVWLLGWFVTQRMLLQEATLTRDFVQSLVAVETPLQDALARPGEGVSAEAEVSFQHIARMPDVLRANVYDRHRTVLWSSDSSLRGRRFGPNQELDMALAGAVMVEKKTHDERVNGKAEYESLAQPDELFVEIYVPVRDVKTGAVVGAIEFYKNPRGLMQILAQLRRYMLAGAVLFGAVLFVALFGLVRRADRLIQAQQQRLVDSETYAALGEMSSAVAHGIRNPLAAMRSSAELIAETARGPARPGDAAVTQEAARDIVEQSDRLGAWLRELLAYTRPGDGETQPLALGPLVGSCLQEFSREIERRRVDARAEVAEGLPPVQADALCVGQVLRSVVANALEAVPDGGRITVSAQADDARGQMLLQVRDNGSGITKAERARVGQPFFTTKAHGMGVGLALARRVLERHGGKLHIASQPGRGTVVSISLRLARGA